MFNSHNLFRSTCWYRRTAWLRDTPLFSSAIVRISRQEQGWMKSRVGSLRLDFTRPLLIYRKGPPALITGRTDQREPPGYNSVPLKVNYGISFLICGQWSWLNNVSVLPLCPITADIGLANCATCRFLNSNHLNSASILYEKSCKVRFFQPLKENFEPMTISFQDQCFSTE